MSDDKTEPPTPKKIRDAHKKGNYLMSREVISSASMLAVLGALMLIWPMTLVQLIAALETALSAFILEQNLALSEVLTATIMFFIHTSVIVYAVANISGIASSMAQTGFVFSFAKFTKGFQSLNAISNAKETFSKKRLFSLGMNILKVCVISLTVLWLVRHFVSAWMASIWCGFECALKAGAVSLISLGWAVAVVFVPLAAIDFLMQRHFYLKDLRMTKDEVKREFKESEGDPEIKGKRREFHQEILSSNMIERTKESTVVVKNPGHYAVALLYDEETTPLPVVVGKGEDHIALMLIAVAEKENIPILDNPPLARALYNDIELECFITRDFIEPVAEIMSYIAELEQQA